MCHAYRASWGLYKSQQIWPLLIECFAQYCMIKNVPGYCIEINSCVIFLFSAGIDECLQQSQRVAEENFEVSGCVTKGSVNAPQKARLNRLKKV